VFPPPPLLPSGKALFPKSASAILLPVAKVTLARLVQKAKALFPIVVTLSGMIMLVKLSQY